MKSLSFFFEEVLFSVRAGQAALSLVFVIGTIITVVAATLAFLIFSFLNSSFGFQAAQRANAAATAGVEDALLRLVRDRAFAAATYPLSVGDATANVSVTQNQSAERATVLSEATVLFRRISLEVIVSVASSTGQVNVVSWKQI